MISIVTITLNKDFGFSKKYSETKTRNTKMFL